MALRIGQSERRAPGAAEQQPLFDAEMTAQGLDVLDQMRRGVVGEFAQRTGAAGGFVLMGGWLLLALRALRR